MAKALVDLREALAKIGAINEETWTRDSFNVELTRALTTLENARMEWNSARLKFPTLAGAVLAGEALASEEKPRAQQALLATQSFVQLCRLGLALTWPVAFAVLVAVGALVALLVRR